MRSPEEQRFPILADIADVPVPRERSIHRIYIHCSDSHYGDAEEIDKWHRERGWKGIGYNYVILGEAEIGTGYQPGFIQIGRDVEKTPAHVASDNTHSLGICIIGKFDTKSPLGNGIDSPGIMTQIQSALILCAELILRLNLPVRQVIGHREVNLIPGREMTSKSCPGSKFDMDEFRHLLYETIKFNYTKGHSTYRLMIERSLRHNADNRRYKYVCGRDVVKGILDSME